MDPRLALAFTNAPRERFLPAHLRSMAFVDRPLPLSDGQTNSQPTTVANMLALLDVEPGQRILDVGSGSGWTTALLAELTGPDGVVVGVERVPELVAGARTALGGSWPWAEVRQATPGVLGAPDAAPFDRILVSAMAAQLPPALLQQLADDAVLVAPVAGLMTRVTRRDGHDDITSHGAYVFVPLVEG